MRHKIKRKSEEEKSGIRTSPELFSVQNQNCFEMEFKF